MSIQLCQSRCKRRADGRIAHLIQTSARTFILALHFLTPGGGEQIQMLQLYRVMRDMITHIVRLDEGSPDFSTYLPHYFKRRILFTAHCLLRMYKSPLKHKLDSKEMETTFHISMDLLKKQSLHPNDLEAKNYVVLEQLWTSSEAFVREGKEQDGLRLGLRDRLVSCHTLLCCSMQ